MRPVPSEGGTEAAASPRRVLEAALEEFSDLPPEAVVKEDCLRRGVWFTPQALAAGTGYARKSYFIFSFDRLPPTDLEAAVQQAAPEEIALEGGAWGFRRVVVSVRLDPGSPYLVALDPEGRPVLTLEGETLAGVEFAPLPPYYGQSCADGTPIMEVAPSIEWGYLLYLTVFRMCQYFGQEEECRFCDINNNFREQRALGNPYFAVKPVERLLDALERVVASGAPAEAYTLTGGSVVRGLQGEDEAGFYVRYARAIEERFPGRWTGKMVVQALPREDARRIRDSGIRIYHPNYEVWDPRLFEIICPGKARHVGRDVWIRRILEAAEVFPPSQVIPNFVAGVEMAGPEGFRTEEEAWASTGEGLEFFMGHGIIPRFTCWCPEPLTSLGRENGPASLRYHAGLLRLWRETHERHGLAAPPGYGRPGAGRAVFSVSAFMDVLDPGTPLAEVV